MKPTVSLYSKKNNDIKNFISSFYSEDLNPENEFKYNISFENPVEMVDIITALIENKEKYNINMWISFDNRVFINVTEYNCDKLIRYIFERYPY